MQNRRNPERLGLVLFGGFCNLLATTQTQMEVWSGFKTGAFLSHTHTLGPHGLHMCCTWVAHGLHMGCMCKSVEVSDGSLRIGSESSIQDLYSLNFSANLQSQDRSFIPELASHAGRTCIPWAYKILRRLSNSACCLCRSISQIKQSVPRIELKTAFNKQATAAALTFCYAAGLRGWISVWCHMHHQFCSLQEPLPKLVVVSRGIFTRPSKPGAFASGNRSAQTTTSIQKTAATTRLLRTLYRWLLDRSCVS